MEVIAIDADLIGGRGRRVPRVFCAKSAEEIENKRDAKLQSAKECASD
jgi:hypothetical protein